MPMTSSFISATTPSTIVTNGEKFIGSVITVTVLAGSHGIVSRGIKNGRQ